MFDTLFPREAYSSEGVLHGAEQMVVRKGNVRAIKLARQNFPADVFQMIFNRLCNMRPRILMMKNYWLVSSRKFRAFFGNLSLQFDGMSEKIIVVYACDEKKAQEQ